MRYFGFVFLAMLLFTGAVMAQPSHAITVIHCDPADPNPSDNMQWPQKVNAQAWLDLEEMVHYADSRNVRLTLQLTMSWVEFILADPVKIDTVHRWQQRGHEIAAHHHMPNHAFWDGYTNIPGVINGMNGAVFIDTMEVFYNQLRVLCSPYPLLTAGIGPAGSPLDSVAIEWTGDLIYWTTNRSRLTPEDNGGRFTDEAFSDPTPETLIDPLRNRQYPVCTLSYCFLANVDTVRSIMEKVSTSDFQVVGGVLHPFNYSASPLAYKAWIDSIASRFPGKCAPVKQVMADLSCQPATAVDEFRRLAEGVTHYYNPESEELIIRCVVQHYGYVRADVYHLSGQWVKTFYTGNMPAGE